jgi:phosphotransferase system enzyme I (PtsI)
MPTVHREEILLSGIGASPGICIGKAYLVDKEGVDVVTRYAIAPDHLKNEIKRFKAAVKRSKDELRAIIENTPEEFRQQTGILEAQEVLLKDKMLYGKTIATIENECVNAEWALKKVVAGLKGIFQNMADSYLRERAADIEHISDRIMTNLTGARGVNIADIDKRVILVARDLSPAETSQIRLERIKGFVTDKGGKASHTGIIARTLELPAVLGLENATQIIKNEDLLIVDGSSGSVIIHPREKTLISYTNRIELYERHKAAISRRGRFSAKTLDDKAMRVLGNIELPEEVVQVVNYGGDGIGLYRTEFQYLSRPDFPSEEELYDRYSDVVQVMAPKPVTLRTLDINGDKALISEMDAPEENPALGLRGIRWCLQRPDVFHSQLRAALRAAVHGNIRLMFPMVAIRSELVQAREMVDRAAESLDRNGTAYNRDIPLGALIEVPSAVIMADVFAKEVDFFSIGTNDLIQYTLAIDRGNKKVSHLFRPLDPAILRMLKHVIDTAHDHGIKVFICGEMAGYPIHIPLLLGLGIDELSMNPQSIPSVKHMIRSIQFSDTAPLVKKVLKLASAEKTFELLREIYKDVLEEIGIGK